MKRNESNVPLVQVPFVHLPLSWNKEGQVMVPSGHRTRAEGGLDHQDLERWVQDSMLSSMQDRNEGF